MNIVNDKVTEYIDSFYNPPNAFLDDLRKDSEAKHIPIILRDTETLILNLIRIKHPACILEIGTAVGYSASCFAVIEPAAKIITLEVDKDMFQTASSNIEKAGLADRIKIIAGDAKDSLTELGESISDSEKDGFDMVFIDAAKGQYKEFWNGCIDLCKDGAVIISDNVLLKARTASDEYVTEKRHKTSVRRMREYLQFISNLDYAATSVLSVGDGVAVSIIKRTK